LAQMHPSFSELNDKNAALTQLNKEDVDDG
jgi:hypothetical protein